MEDSILEIRNLYLDAIYAAEKLIYIENQYFSSHEVYKALVDRMMAPNRPRLEIVIIVPDRMHAFFEEIGMGIAQVKALRSLKEIASQNNHSLGIYYPASITVSTILHPSLGMAPPGIAPHGIAPHGMAPPGMATRMRHRDGQGAGGFSLYPCQAPAGR